MAFGSDRKNKEVEYSQYPSQEPESSRSYLGKTLQIKGEIKSNEYLTVEGKVEGNINITKTLTIGKNGYVDGEINAETVRIDGQAQGNITASAKLQISSHGRFSGNIKSEKLVIEEGAIFQGKANVDE